MLDPFEFCIISSLKSSARKVFQPIKALRKLRLWKRKNPKRLFSDSDNSPSSFASMEVADQLKQVFEFFDTNGDGKISPLELREVLLSLGYEKETAIREADGMVREMDRDGDGYVDIEEFMRAVNVDEKMGCGDDELMDAFKIFDCDGNGLICAKELRRVLISLGYENCKLWECKEMIRWVDKDGDGFVDFEEFKEMMRCPELGR